MAIQDSDAFLVARSGTNYQTPATDIMAIEDTDLLVVNRGGINYKATGAELVEYVAGGAGQNWRPVTGSGLTSSQTVIGVGYCAGTFLIACSDQTTYRSTDDGLTWTPGTLPATGLFSASNFGTAPGFYLYTSTVNNGRSYSSTNGFNWTTFSGGPSPTTSLTYSGVLSGNYSARSGQPWLINSGSNANVGGFYSYYASGGLSGSGNGLYYNNSSDIYAFRGGTTANTTSQAGNLFVAGQWRVSNPNLGNNTAYGILGPGATSNTFVGSKGEGPSVWSLPAYSVETGEVDIPTIGVLNGGNNTVTRSRAWDASNQFAYQASMAVGLNSIEWVSFEPNSKIMTAVGSGGVITTSYDIGKTWSPSFLQYKDAPEAVSNITWGGVASSPTAIIVAGGGFILRSTI